MNNGLFAQVLKTWNLPALSGGEAKFAAVKLGADVASGGRMLFVDLEISLHDKNVERFWLDFHDGKGAIGWISTWDVVQKAEPETKFVRAVCSFFLPSEVNRAVMRFVTEKTPAIPLFELDFGAEFECTVLDSRCRFISGERSGRGNVALVGGIAKSGTTWVSAALNRHRDMLMLNEAELFCDLEPVRTALRAPEAMPHYVGLKRHAHDPLDRSMISNFRQGLHTAAFIQSTTGVGVIGDKSPAYAFYYDKILNLISGVRVVHCERNPADTFVSRVYHDAAIYRQDPALLHESIPNEVLALFESGALGTEAELDLNRWGDALEKLIEIFAYEYSYIQYQRELAKRAFPTKFHIVQYEDILNNPLYEFNKIFSFLGCPLSKFELERIVRLSSFKFMSGGRENGEPDSTSFFRKGVVGDARRFLGAKGLVVFDKILKNNPYRKAPKDSFVSDLVNLNHLN